MFSSVVRKAVSKSKHDATRYPTLTALVNHPSGSRGFTKEVDSWLDEHDVLYLLEGLSSHLLRTLPSDEVDECDKYLDAQKLSRAGTKANLIPLADIFKEDGDHWFDSATVMEEKIAHVQYGWWMNQKVMISLLQRRPKLLKGTALKSHLYCVSCTATAGPQLANLRHEHVIPTFGYVLDAEVVATMHPRMDVSLRDVLKAMLNKHQHMTVGNVLRIAEHVLDGLGYLHTLGFLHRNLTGNSIYFVPSHQELSSAFSGIPSSPSLSGTASATRFGSVEGSKENFSPLSITPSGGSFATPSSPPQSPSKLPAKGGWKKVAAKIATGSLVGTSSFSEVPKPEGGPSLIVGDNPRELLKLHLAVGGFSTLVRSSRGRVVSAAWMPTCPAPETLQSRVFDSATDMFSFGVLLLEALSYGASANIAQPPTERPPHVSLRLWAKLLGPCLAPIPTERLTLSEAIQVVRKLKKEIGDEVIPLPSDTWLDSTSLACLVRAGAPPDVTSLSTLELQGLHEKAQWEALSRLLSSPQCLIRRLHLRRCTLPKSCQYISPLSSLSLTDCTNTSFETIVSWIREALANSSSAGHASQEGTDSTGTNENETALCLTQIDVSGNSLAEDSSHSSSALCWGSFVDILTAPAVASVIQSIGLGRMDLNPPLIRQLTDAMCKTSATLSSTAFHQLRSLDLSGNTLNADSISRLCERLQRLPRFTQLRLTHVQGLDYFGVTAIAQLIRQHAVSGSLREVDLRGVSVSPSARRVLQKAAVVNRAAVGPPGDSAPFTLLLDSDVMSES